MSLELNAMFRKLAGTLANLDLQENQARQGANRQRMEREDSNKDSQKKLSETMSGRGLAHSGISLGQNVKLQKAFQNTEADADQALQTVLTNVAKNRLAAQSEFDQGSAATALSRLSQR